MRTGPVEKRPAEFAFDLLAGTPDGAFAVDRRQRIAFWNEGARRILGFEPGSVLGRSCHEVVGGVGEDGCVVCERRCATFRATLRGQLLPTRVVKVRTRDGDGKWVSVTTFVLPSGWHELSLLAHVFREPSAVERTELLLSEALRAVGPGGRRGGLPRPEGRLTKREREILQLLAAGAATSEIRARLGIDTTTVRTHVQHVLAKLGVHSRLEAVAFAARNGVFRD